jgi:hypothetical protein
MTITPQQRKESSIHILQEQNIPYIDTLPPIEPSNQLKHRSANEIAIRAVCSLLTIQVACEFLQQGDLTKAITFFRNMLRQYGVENNLTPEEINIFSGTFTEQDAINAAWRYESLWVLLWALGIVHDLSYPSTICDCDVAIRAVSTHKGMESLLGSTKLRSLDEIMDMADLTYRYDWACVEARIKGKEAPAGLDSGIVMERHKGFSWLLGFIGNDNWDTPAINT